MFQMFYSCEKSIPRKHSVLSIEKFSSLALPKNAIMAKFILGTNYPPETNYMFETGNSSA